MAIVDVVRVALEKAYEEVKFLGNSGKENNLLQYR